MWLRLWPAAHAERASPALCPDGAVQSDAALLYRRGTAPDRPGTELADVLNASAWRTHAAGEGTKGLRLYDRARIPLPWTVDEGFELIRRSRAKPEERASYFRVRTNRRQPG